MLDGIHAMQAYPNGWYENYIRGARVGALYKFRIDGWPDDLRALSDAAHSRGLIVLLDVVYNHFGPEGNYLPRYAPQLFAPANTPWGSAIDYRVMQVRSFAIDNALHWLSHYRFDGLRLDAVHAITQPG